MPSFSIQLATIITSFAYVLATGITFWWIHASRQPYIPRSLLFSGRVALRWLTVFLALFATCAIVDIPAWTIFASLIALILLARFRFPLSFLVLPIVLVIWEYVLWFPNRKDLVLEPNTDKSENAKAHDALQPHIGVSATTATPLKPTGQVTIADGRFDAASEGGVFVESGTDVTVIGVRNGALLVRIQ